MKGFVMEEYKVIQEFEAFIRNSNAKPHDNITINADGKVHRYRVEGDRAGSKNGAYCLYTDGVPNGYAMNWKDGKEEKELWTYCYSDDEKREYAKSQNDPDQRAKTEADRRERERRKAEELKRQEERVRIAFNEWQNAWPITDPLTEHPYLKNKFDGLNLSYTDDDQFRIRYGGTPDDVDYSVITNYPPKLCRGTIEGGICKAGELLVPTRNILTGAFNGLIRIAGKPDAEGHWPKLNYKGISPTGAAYIIRPEHAKIEAVYVCEGFGTAVALMVLLDCQYIIFSAGTCHNLKPVCESLRKRLPYGTKIIIAADNDKPDSKGKNAGLDAANACVKSGVADSLISPDTNGTDWADELILERKGLMKNDC